MRRSHENFSPDFVKFQFCNNLQNQLDDPPHFTHLKFGDPPQKRVMKFGDPPHYNFSPPHAVVNGVSPIHVCIGGITKMSPRKVYANYDLLSVTFDLSIIYMPPMKGISPYI